MFLQLEDFNFIATIHQATTSCHYQINLEPSLLHCSLSPLPPLSLSLYLFLLKVEEKKGKH